jgi:16S rRNA (guanine(966)-N(2))-methyltransferase RsmD
MAREGLFNILTHREILEGAKILDLFFGTGAMSLEFLSRGAASATAIDIEKQSKAHLDKIAKEWSIDNLKVIHADVFRILKNPKGSFDLVFADPPFAEKRLNLLPDLVMNAPWLGESGIFILEHGSSNDFSDHPQLFETHRFGSVHFSFFK